MSDRPEEPQDRRPPEEQFSPSQTPAERAHHSDVNQPVPPEEDRQGPQARWEATHAPPKEREEMERSQVEQAERLREHRREQLDAETARLHELGLEIQPTEMGVGGVPGGSPSRQEEYPSTQGAAAPEPVGAKDHQPGEFEQPQREEYTQPNGDRSRPYGDAA